MQRQRLFFPSPLHFLRGVTQSEPEQRLDGSATSSSSAVGIAEFRPTAWKLSEDVPQVGCFVSADANYGCDAALAVSDSPRLSSSRQDSSNRLLANFGEFGLFLATAATRDVSASAQDSVKEGRGRK